MKRRDLATVHVSREISRRKYITIMVHVCATLNFGYTFSNVSSRSFDSRGVELRLAALFPTERRAGRTDFVSRHYLVDKFARINLVSRCLSIGTRKFGVAGVVRIAASVRARLPRAVFPIGT